MPSYDDDLPTEQEELLLKQLTDHVESQQRLEALIELKNLIIGSKRCKAAFHRAGTLTILLNLLKDYASSITSLEIVIQILDCISSFVKSNNPNVIQSLVDLGFIEQIFILLTTEIDSQHFYEACLRCLRSFFLPETFSNPYLTPIPFILSCDHDKLSSSPSPIESDHSLAQENNSPVAILFETTEALDILHRLLSTSKAAQISIVEILCCACVNKQRQEQIVEKEFIQAIMHLFVENIFSNNKQQLNSSANEYLLEVCLKFFCSICYENPLIAQQLHATKSTRTKQNLCELISSLLNKLHRPVVTSYYASKCFVNLCKTKVLACDDLYVSHEALTTLIHLCTKSNVDQSSHLYIECLDTLIYLLNGNSTLHHTAMYSEQFLSQLFVYIFTPSKILNRTNDVTILIQIRSSALTLLAVLSSYHEDIKKRIADQENLISTAIECYRSPHFSLQLASLRLFHGLSRSVHQLRTTFNDTICDILLAAVQSSDLTLVKTASSVISNSVLEFSICRTRLLLGGILDILLSFLTHTDRELSINSIWALRNLSYLSTLKVKQDIINGLTIDRIYSLLEQCTDEQFLLCLLSLLRNLFHEKDIDALLPMFNSVKLSAALQKTLAKKYPEEIDRELKILIDHVNASTNPSQQRLSADSVNITCRTSLFPEYACDEMDQLDCS